MSLVLLFISININRGPGEAQHTSAITGFFAFISILHFIIIWYTVSGTELHIPHLRLTGDRWWQGASETYCDQLYKSILHSSNTTDSVEASFTACLYTGTARSL